MMLEVLIAGEVVERLTLGAAALHLGRAPGNDLVLHDAGVSGHHAVIWPEDGSLWVRDLGSTNGTHVEPQPSTTWTKLQGKAQLQPGDQLRLGPTVILRLSEGAEQPAAHGPLRLELVNTSVSLGITTDRFPLPNHPDALLLLYPQGITLAIHGEETLELHIDQPFQVAGHTYVVRRDTAPTPATLRPILSTYDYTLQVSLHEPVAVLSGREEGTTVRFTAENHVAFLYALGHAWLTDARGDAGGWVCDEQVALAVWGREHRKHGTNNVNVLLHRIRHKLKQAGLDRWCLEKRRGQIRIRVCDATLS